MVVKKKSDFIFRIFLHTFFILLSAVFIVPLLSVIFIAFTSEASITMEGYPMFFREFDTTAFQYVFDNPSVILNAYKVTIIISAAGTFLYLLMCSMAAYVISRPGYGWTKPLTFYFYFTMLFNGGLVPSYILISNVLHMKNTYWALILPSLAYSWYLIIMKTFMKGIPNEIIESAKIDGANHWTIYTHLVLPLSKPSLATIGLLMLLSYWNSWQPAMLYITDKDLYPLQYLLQVMLRNIMEILKQMNNSTAFIDISGIPSESTRMAMCLLAVGPMLLVFPFFQKYFTRGLTVGAVKG